MWAWIFHSYYLWDWMELFISLGGTLLSLPQVPWKLRRQAAYIAMLSLAAVGWLAFQYGLVATMLQLKNPPDRRSIDTVTDLCLINPTLVFICAVPVAFAATGGVSAGWPRFTRSVLFVAIAVLGALATHVAFAFANGQGWRWESPIAIASLGAYLVCATDRRGGRFEEYGLLAAVYLLFVTIASVADAAVRFAEFGFGGGTWPALFDYAAGDPLPLRVRLAMQLTLQSGVSAAFAALPLMAFGFHGQPAFGRDGRWSLVAIVMMGVVTTSPVPFLLLLLTQRLCG